MSKIEELLQLMRDNPDFPIVPMVSGQIDMDDSYRYWMADWGGARVDEYIVGRTGVFFKSDDMWETLEEYLPLEEFDSLPAAENKCKAIYDALPWKKAIIVRIDEL